MLGIFGGTFDPIHLGHLHLANTVQEKAHLSHIKIIPCHQSPLRQPPITSAKDRAAMVELAINEYSHLTLDKRELNNPPPSYAVNTVESVRLEIGAHTSLCLIMGDDAFAQFRNWHEWEKILKLAHLIVTTREIPIDQTKYSPEIMEILHQHQTPQARNLTTKAAGYIWLVDIQPLDISATKIRELLKNHQDAQDFLPPLVWQYIKKHGLYQA